MNGNTTAHELLTEALRLFTEEKQKTVILDVKLPEYIVKFEIKVLDCEQIINP